MPWSCQHCFREYKREANYKKHVLTCQILHESDIPEERVLPSQEDMYNILVSVIRDQTKLRNELQELKKVVHIKKKISYISWLETYRKPRDTYIKWVNNLSFKLSHFELVTSSSNYMRSISLVLRDIINVPEQATQIPLASFDKQLSSLYIFTDEGSWRLCTDNDLRTIIDVVSNSISNLMNEWEKISKAKLSKDDFDEQYARNIIRIMGPSIGYSDMCYQFRKILHDIVKLNLSNVIEYEFTH